MSEVEKVPEKGFQLDTNELALMPVAYWAPSYAALKEQPGRKYKRRAKGLEKKEKWHITPKMRTYKPGRPSAQIELRTQKSRGVSAGAALSNYGAIPRWLSIAPILSVMPQCFDDLEAMKYPIFARPCPRRPRHGFIESRIVNNHEELLKVVAETMAEDRLGEVMCMPPLTGKASAVATDSGVVWGVGNAGVTAGKGKQVTIPIPRSPNQQSMTEYLTRHHSPFRKEIKGSTFIEVVEHDGEPTIVQMRDGPADVAVGGNYIPHANYKVTNVIVPNWEEIENLIKWEARVAGAPAGTVIVLKNASLTSHCAVHGLANKFAVITTGPFIDNPELLKEGMILQPESNQPAPLTGDDYKKIAKFMRKTIHGSKRARAAFSVSVLHAMSVWGNDPMLLWLRAAGVITMAKLIVSACAGEARHFYRCGPGRYTEGAKPAIDWKKITGRELSGKSRGYPERSVVLQSVYRYSIKRLAVVAEACTQDFRGCWNGRITRSGRTRGACGYGGPKWRESSKAARKLCAAIISFQGRPCEKTWAEVAMCYNMAVCLAHNGGRVLNKWAGADEIDACAKYPQFGLLSPQAMFICTGVKEEREAGVTRKKKKKLPVCGIPDCTICQLKRVE